jgi:TatD DNase family protein
VNLVDSHCHLDDAQFEPDREAVIERAVAAGVRYMLAIGTGDGPPDLKGALRLAERYDFIYATGGVHPNDAAKADWSTFENLRAILPHPKIKAVGEIGLDYHWGVPPELQFPVFRKQLELAAEAKIPVVIHTRDAWADTMDVLRKEWAPVGIPCIMHCFTGNVEQARACLDLGFYLSFGGVATFPKAAEVREAVRIVPDDRLLIETDCPYLAPVPHRGKRNEPAYVAETLKALAAVRETEPEDLAGRTTANFEHLFGLSSYTEGFNPGD